jgi:hypothetical protein
MLFSRKMGTDDRSVVDSKLCVYGVKKPQGGRRLHHATSHHREYQYAVRHHRRAHGGNAFGVRVNGNFCFSATSKYYPFQKERGTKQ